MSYTNDRNTGDISFSSNYEVKKTGPLDARLITPEHAQLYDPATMDYRYPGMCIAVYNDPQPAKNGLWMNTNISEATTVTGLAESDWVKIGGGAAVGGGNPVTKMEYDLPNETLIVTLTHDGNGNLPDWQADGSPVDVSGASNTTKNTGEIVFEGIDVAADFDGKYIPYLNGDYTLVTATLDGSDTVLTFLGDADFVVGDTSIQPYLNAGPFPITFNTVIPAGGSGGKYDPDDQTLDSPVSLTTQMPKTVGGLKVGTLASELHEKPFSEIWNRLLFPVLKPVAGSISTTLEGLPSLAWVNSTITDTFETGADTGQWKLDGSNQGEYAGPVTASVITPQNSTAGSPINLTVGPGSEDIEDVPIEHLIILGSADNTWQIETTFADGPAGLDSVGNPVTSPAPFSSTSTTDSTSIEGVYPVYAGLQKTLAEGGGNAVFDNGTLISHGSAKFIVDQQMGEDNPNNWHRISISNTMIANRSVEIWAYNYQSSQWEDFTIKWNTTSETRPDGAGNPVAYTLFTKSNDPGGGPQRYEVRF